MSTASYEDLERETYDFIGSQLRPERCPSAWELVERVEKELGWRARSTIRKALLQFANDASCTRLIRQYIDSVVQSGDLEAALAGTSGPRREVQTGIDALLRQSAAYRSSTAFEEMITFIGRFRDYAAYNNMLVQVQNPSCSFYATESDWQRRFGRRLREDARPMLILAPMHPVMLVFDLDQTEGPELPEQLSQLSAFRGDWDPAWWDRAVAGARLRDRIRVDLKSLSATNSGFAARIEGDSEFKMRIVVHSQLDPPSQFGVLCHELAHIYLGHLGTDGDYWWPSRRNLDHTTVEVEAESVAYLVTTRLGLSGASAAYVSHYVGEAGIPPKVSLDLIAKVAGRIEDMAKHKLEPRPSRAADSVQMKLL